MPLRLSTWLDERVGAGAIGRTLLQKPLGPHVNWLFTLGATLLFLLCLQFVTGVLLAIYYVASADHAYQSVTAIGRSVPLGWLVRGLHYWGATLVVAIALLHLLRVVLYGSYKKPREATWMGGVLLLLVILGFSFTGYLLPWDQKAYWATVVGTHIAGTVPWIGQSLMHVLRGGPDVGGATLSRFYAIHVLLLPAILGALVLAHLYLVQLHGISEGMDPSDARRPSPFFPAHAIKDAAVMALAYMLLLVLASLVPAPLEEMANPVDASYVPRPEWYFYPFYELLKFFNGPLLPVGTVVIPLGFVVLLLLLPFLDSSPHRDPLSRPMTTAAMLSMFVGAVYLTSIGAGRAATREVVLPEGPAPPVRLAGALLFEEKSCDSCHSVLGIGGRSGPDLWRAGEKHDREWLRKLLKDPDSMLPKGTMPRYDLPERDMRALLAYVESLDFSRHDSRRMARAIVRGGGELWRSGCLDCHRADAPTPGLSFEKEGGRRTYQWLQAYLADPSFHKDAARSVPQISPSRRNDIARYLSDQP
ncbi:MAG: cytochrome b N-terminal domain-containing protein [Acidobacteria bacterium]|nr:cytochrome b N-terminal domain-containing protein [Acidobacteriota bacterium]